MRLLLDEHFSPQIASQLRSRGHDVVAVADDEGLRGKADHAIFTAASNQGRAIVSRDLAGFRPPVSDAMAEGKETHGLVCVPRQFARDRRETGRLVRALDAFLTANPDDDAVLKRGGEVWLEEP